MSTGEYLREDQFRAVRQIIRSAGREGVRTTCGILFGSRARGEARSDCDVDLLLLLRFPRNTSSLSDPRLIYTRRFGHAVANFFGRAGRIQVFMYNQDVLLDGIQEARLMPEEAWIRGLAQDGQVIYGREPEIDERPFLQFLREHFGSAV